MTLCPRCDTQIESEVRFCPQCGENLEQPDSASSPTRPSADSVAPREKFLQGVSDRQADDVEPEDDLWSGSYSKKAMVGHWLAGGIVSLAALILGVIFVKNGAGWLMLVGLLAAMWGLLVAWYGYRRLSVHYRLTTQRLIHEAGMLWRTIDRIELIDIDDVTFKQGPVERMFRIGTIHISSSDKTTPELALPGIDNVRRIADEIDDARRKERRRRGLHIEAV